MGITVYKNPYLHVEEFIKKMYPYAEYASKQTDIPIEVILSQWALETGWGRENEFINGLNLAGIKKNSTGSEFAYGDYAGYSTLENSVNDWIRVMNKDYYNGVREASSVPETIQALHSSPWAEDTLYDDRLHGVLNTIKKIFPNVSSENSVIVKNSEWLQSGDLITAFTENATNLGSESNTSDLLVWFLSQLQMSSDLIVTMIV